MNTPHCTFTEQHIDSGCFLIFGVAPGQQLEIPLRDKNGNQVKKDKKRPRVIIKVEEVNLQNDDVITLEMTGHGLPAMDYGFLCFGGKSDPYLEFQRFVSLSFSVFSVSCCL